MTHRHRFLDSYRSVVVFNGDKISNDSDTEKLYAPKSLILINDKKIFLCTFVFIVMRVLTSRDVYGITRNCGVKRRRTGTNTGRFFNADPAVGYERFQNFYLTRHRYSVFFFFATFIYTTYNQ